MRKLLFLALIVTLSFSGCPKGDDFDEAKLGFYAVFTENAPVIDGDGSDAVWEKAAWHNINYAWMYQPPMSLTGTLNDDGTVTKSADFSGKFKVLWTADRLYILAEIVDDVIKRAVPDNRGRNGAHNNDCLEIFIDEDASGGARAGVNNFFAYHINFYNAPGYAETDKNVFDYVAGASSPEQLRNSHLNYEVGIDAATNTYTWEIEMKVYNSSHPVIEPVSPSEENLVTLSEGKKIGFAIAYCDNDSDRNERDSFIGSHFVTGNNDNDRNISYLNSSQYAILTLTRIVENILE